MIRHLYICEQSVVTVLKLMLISFLSGLAMISHAQILANDVAANANLDLLRQEVEVISTIKNGAILSVAECELFEDCDANVNKNEIEQLLDTIDSRVALLSVRYTQSGDPTLEEVLLGYVDIRDGYSNILDKMELLPQFQHQLETSDLGIDFFGTGAPTGQVPDDLFRLFMDIDEELVDDELFIDDEL